MDENEIQTVLSEDDGIVWGKCVVGKCVYDSRVKYSGSWDAAPAILNYIKVDEIGTLN